MRKTRRHTKRSRKSRKNQRGGAIRSGYFHYSSSPLTKEDFKNIYTPPPAANNINNSNIFAEMTSGMKPGGLWFAKGTEWRNTNAFMGGDYIYDASFEDDKLLILDTIEKVKTFTDTYGVQGFMIDWLRVANDYDGVLFENYSNVKRAIMADPNRKNTVKLTWFLSVDVNSVCIWRPNKVIRSWGLVNDR